jgi:outer membrane protein assembly factor BamA
VLHRLLPLLCLALTAASGQVRDCPEAQPEQTIPAPIRLITFSNAALLPQEKQQEIAQIYRDRHVSPGSVERDMDSFAEELGERVRAEYQNMGYFKVEVDSHTLKTADEHVYDLEAQVRSLGPQYRLGDIRFLGATAFPVTQLRDLFRMQRGEVFSRVKVAEGLEQLRRLYGSQGYINYTPVPTTQFDDQTDVVNLTIDSDEGKQFRVGGIKVSGVDDLTKTRLLSELGMKVGDIYSTEAARKLRSEFPALVQTITPSGVSPEPQEPGTVTLHEKLDEATGVVDVVLNFQKAADCPGAPIRLRESPGARN